MGTGSLNRAVSAFLLILSASAILLYSRSITIGAYSGFILSNSGEISEALRTAMQNRTYRVNVRFSSYAMNKGQVEEVTGRLISDAFYESADPKGGDYLRYQYGGYELRYSVERKALKYAYTLKITPVYYSTAVQEEAVDLSVSALLSSPAFSTAATDYEKASLVRDYICETTDYDTVHKHTPGSGHIQSTAYGALLYHTSLCQGYAVLCHRLLKELGMKCRIITGTATVSGAPEKHAWNIVQIGDYFYNMDVTLDDVSATREYFLKSDRKFSSDHQRDEEYSTREFYSRYPMDDDDYMD